MNNGDDETNQQINWKFNSPRVAVERQPAQAPFDGALSLPRMARLRVSQKPSRAVTTSGKARTKGWRLVFERRTAPFIEPLMGYTGGDDTTLLRPSS